MTDLFFQNIVFGAHILPEMLMLCFITVFKHCIRSFSLENHFKETGTTTHGMKTSKLCMQFGLLSVSVAQMMQIVLEFWFLISYLGYLYRPFQIFYRENLSSDSSYQYRVLLFLSKVGIGDPHCVVFHLPGGSNGIHVCKYDSCESATEVNFSLNTSISDELLIALLKLLKKYLMDDSVVIVDMTSQVLRVRTECFIGLCSINFASVNTTAKICTVALNCCSFAGDILF